MTVNKLNAEWPERRKTVFREHMREKWRKKIEPTNEKSEPINKNWSSVTEKNRQEQRQEDQAQFREILDQTLHTAERRREGDTEDAKIQCPNGAQCRPHQDSRTIWPATWFRDAGGLCFWHHSLTRKSPRCIISERL